jgi:hypothetical protein
MRDRQLPPITKFETEAEEAKWWFDHREESGRDLVDAMKVNGVGKSSAMRRARQQREELKKSSAA